MVSTQPIRPVLIVDPRMEHGEVINTVYDGPASVTYQSVKTPDPTSLNPSFTIQPPSQSSGVSRCIRLRTKGTFTITSAGIQAAWRATSSVALRQFPMQSIANSIQISINDFTVNLSTPSQIVPLLGRLGVSDEAMASTLSTCPSVPDAYSDYSMDTAATGGAFSRQGDAPFSMHTAAGRTAEITAIWFPSADSAVVAFESCEPLIVSPLLFGRDQAKSLYGINTMVIQLSYGANPGRALSMNLGAIGAKVAVTACAMALEEQTLEVSFTTPSDYSLSLKPASWTYGVTNVQSYISTIGATINRLAPQATAPPIRASVAFSTNPLELSVVPSRLVIAVMRDSAAFSDSTQSLPDVCLPITSLQVRFGMRAGLLSGATQRQLYDMSRRAGVNMKYHMWAGDQAVVSTGAPAAAAAAVTYAGGPVVIDVAADLSLPDDITAGSVTRISLSVEGTVSSQVLDADIANARIILIALTDGLLSSNGGATSATMGTPIREIKAARAEAIPLAYRAVAAAHRNGGYSGGGGFLDNLIGNLDRKTKPLAAMAPLAAAIGAPELLPQANALAKLFGNGAAVGGASVGGARRRPRGGAALELA